MHRLSQSRAMSPTVPLCLSLGQQHQSRVRCAGAQQGRAAPRAALEPVLAKRLLDPNSCHGSGSLWASEQPGMLLQPQGPSLLAENKVLLSHSVSVSCMGGGFGLAVVGTVTGGADRLFITPSRAASSPRRWGGRRSRCPSSRSPFLWHYCSCRRKHQAEPCRDSGTGVAQSHLCGWQCWAWEGFLVPSVEVAQAGAGRAAAPACPRAPSLRRPLFPSLSQSSWWGVGCSAQAWGGFGAPTALLLGCATQCPSRRIQGAGVSPCLEPEVPRAHPLPDVTNATMGTGSE